MQTELDFMPEFWTKNQSERAQDRIAKNERDGILCCMACGLRLNPERAKTVWIVGGGTTVLPKTAVSTNRPDEDMGCWDLGPECATMFPAAARRPYGGAQR